MVLKDFIICILAGVFFCAIYLAGVLHGNVQGFNEGTEIQKIKNSKILENCNETIYGDDK